MLEDALEIRKSEFLSEYQTIETIRENGMGGEYRVMRRSDQKCFTMKTVTTHIENY